MLQHNLMLKLPARRFYKISFFPPLESLLFFFFFPTGLLSTSVYSFKIKTLDKITKNWIKYSFHCLIKVFFGKGWPLVCHPFLFMLKKTETIGCYLIYLHFSRLNIFSSGLDTIFFIIFHAPLFIFFYFNTPEHPSTAWYNPFSTLHHRQLTSMFSLRIWRFKLETLY